MRVAVPSPARSFRKGLSPMDLAQYPVAPQKIVAIATDSYLTPTYDFADKDIPGTPPQYGQDFTFGTGRFLPAGMSVGGTEAALKPQMEALLGVFASDDHTGMARRLFDRFLAKQTQVTYFE